MTAWIGKMIDCVQRKYFGGCIDRLPRLQNTTDASLFFLTNEAGTAFRLHARQIVDQVRTHLSLNVQETFSTILLLLWTLR